MSLDAESSIMQQPSVNNKPAYLEAEHLLRLAQDGDREALGALLYIYRRHMSRLARNQIGRRLHVKADTSDLAQDVCLEVHRHFEKFAGTTEAEFGAWIRKILAGLVANSVRRYQGTKKRDVRRERPLAHKSIDSTQVYGNETVARGGTPSEEAVDRETNVQLAVAMEQLAPHYRQVIELRIKEGMPFAEIALEMGRTVDSVEKLWWRAVGKLRNLIEQPK
ncbi:MAG TPA: sigma-70 family RNA polymerase sigma factor [Pirellulales bacterium]|nr:sigma-70 family RNA polymerase sigma factor [Pirellulales bacterium]